MKKKIALILVFVIGATFLFILLMNSNLIRLKSSLSETSNRLAINGTTICKLRGNALSNIQLFEGKLTNNSNIEISEVTKSSQWIFGSDDKNIQLISDGSVGVFDIVSFTVKGVSAGTGRIEVTKLNGNLAFTDANLNTYNLSDTYYEITVTSNENNSNNSGNNSSPSSGNLVPYEPILSSSVYDIDNEKLLINKVSKDHSDETIKNNIKINYGSFEIDGDNVIVSYDGKTKVYKMQKMWIPKTGQNVIKYSLIISVLVILIVSLLFIVKKRKK